MERYPVGSDDWAEAAAVFNMLIQKACDEVAEPEWWNDEGLKALSTKVVSEGGAERHESQPDAGYGAERAG